MPDPTLLATTDAFCASVAAFDAARYSGEDCVRIAEALSRAAKASTAAAALAAARAASSGSHRARGFHDPADWLARTTGAPLGQARAALDLAGSVDECAETKDAMVAGEISLAQAKEIVSTEAERPGSEHELLDLARRASFRELKDEARSKRLGGIAAEELHARQHAARSAHHHRDALGMVQVQWAMPPEIGVPFVNRLDAETDRRWRAAKRAGRVEPREALAADALAAMVAGQGKGHARAADLVIVVDLRAWRRGHAHEGEPCHIVGGGPIPVSRARSLGADAFLKAVTHDGVRIESVLHVGRHIPAELRTALDLGPVPGFDGVRCADGCGRQYGLQWDHVDPRANDGPTSFANLQARCRGDHQDKTARDRAAGLLVRKRRTDPPP